MDRRKFLSTAGIATAGVTTLAAPAIAQSVRDMVIVSTYGRDFPGLGLSAQRLADRITQLSEGRIRTEYFAAGERVGAFDVFDDVAGGNSHAYTSADYFFTGKHAAFAFFTGVPFGMTSPEWNAWINFGGGQELWDDLSADFGLKKLPCGGTGAQSGGWFNKEINSPEDLRGLKMRIPGMGGNVMSKLGASTVSLPGGQIYENLVSGAIDATEYVGPYNDYFLKLYEAAKYYYVDGMHEPGGGNAFGMNKTWWEGLSDWEQSVITAACQEENGLGVQEVSAKNGEYLSRLVNEHGVQLREFNEDVWDVFGEAAMEVNEEVRDHSAMAAKVGDAYNAALREIGGFRAKAEVAFSRQRNRVFDLG
ncbi:TRAP transporter substrate-binding protein [Epibacterium ulvae]|uniref:TRAP transporter substrate-binding protein n=1 Tax=Epibacterium ulvae TaxID=1156985 RepID=UPI001BFC6E6C|nr:TRAP transporter substrate-binding protein [Epibacterium ulvae]MBT8153906.1 TRAP transporter substrate-binding protein [Epibacterium ulvae]